MPHFSGVGHYILELLQAIDKQLDEDSSLKVSILVYFRDAQKVRNFGFRNISIIRSPFPLRITNGLKNYCIQPPLDLFFGSGIYIFPNFSSWPLIHSKNITFIYDMSYEKYPKLADPHNQIFLAKQAKKSINRASMIASISESSKNDISNFYGLAGHKIEIFYPAVDTSIYYHRSLDEISTVMNKYNIKGDYILFVGNIEPRKNLKNLLLAYENLPQEIQDNYSLLIIGAKGWQDGEIFETIKRLRKLGKSIQLPSKYVSDNDLPALYSGAKIFIYPSIYEGFGMPPIEAMACGAPVIASDNSSLPESVGDAALMVKANSVNDISNKMKDLLSSQETRDKLIEKGYVQIMKYSWVKSANLFIKMIKNLK